jgi:hypothetical protein
MWKHFFLREKNRKMIQIAPSMDLLEYGSILTIEKSITIIWLKFSWERFLI